LLDEKNHAITFQKEKLEKLHDELKKSEENLNIAQSSALLANWEWNSADGRFTFSKTLPLIYDADPDALQKNFKEVFISKAAPEYQQQFINLFDGSRSGINTSEFDYNILTSRGKKWLKTKIFADHDEEKNVIKLFGTVQDITKNKIEENNKIEIAAQRSFTKQLIKSQEEERKRIAGEMHDSIGQEILLVNHRAQLLLMKQNIDSDTSAHLNEIINSSSGLLNLVREISFNLRPVHIERVGLTETIASAVQRVKDTTGINFNCEIENIDNLFLPEPGINLFRIIQEGINNIVKHSKAENASVKIQVKDNIVALEITDDGKGFNVKAKGENGGFGLSNILNRVNILNGKLNILSSLSGGTKLEITIPAVNA